MAQRSEQFGRLLKAGISSIALCEGKTVAVVDEELGRLIGVSDATVERYKTGTLPGEQRTIEILADACVRRGLHNGDWLQQFLYAARYPAPERLLAQLVSAPQPNNRPPRVYKNLPAPSYTRFITREAASREVYDGLRQRTAAVAIVGLGGTGKTSLAHEIAVESLERSVDVPPMDAAVWVSDKDRPGTTNLRTVLDEIARTLDYPGLTQLDPDEKQREVEHLLRQQRVLIVVDNAETITDDRLIHWLLRLPEPSKALLTSREYLRPFRRGCWPVELRGMAEDEARALIAQRLRVLKLEKLVADPAQLLALIAATGGNPLAIELTLGLIKYERRPLTLLIDELYAARGDLFENLFQRAWALLDEAARRVLLVLTLFPVEASADALAHSADVRGYAFDQAVERLSDLSLLEEHQVDLQHPPRLSLHALVRAFAQARLAETPYLEAGARERWLGWCLSVTDVANAWAPATWMATFPAEAPTVDAALEWCIANQRYDEVARLGPLLGRYYSLRGEWGQLETVRLRELHAAQARGDLERRLHALRNLLEIKTLQGNEADAERYYERVQELHATERLSGVAYEDYRSAITLYHLERGEVALALGLIEAEEQPAIDYPRHQRPWRLYLLARCHYLLGDRARAEEYFRTAYNEAQQRAYYRGMVFALLGLCTVALDREASDVAAPLLGEAWDLITRDNDRRMEGAWQRMRARLYRMRGEREQAAAALVAAIDIIERLGWRRDLAEARAELAALAAG